MNVRIYASLVGVGFARSALLPSSPRFWSASPRPTKRLHRNSKNQSDVGQDSVSSNSRKYLICLLSVTPPRVTTFVSQVCEKRYQSQHVHYRMKWIGLLCVSASQNSVRKPTDVLVLYVLSCVCSRFWIDVALVSRCCHNVFYRLQNNRIIYIYIYIYLYIYTFF